MPPESRQQHTIGSGESLNAFVSFLNRLEIAPVEKLTGTPTVTISPSGPTLANKAVNTAVVFVRGESRGPGQVVQWSITGCTDATLYTVTISVSTDATVSQTFVRTVKLLCKD